MMGKQLDGQTAVVVGSAPIGREVRAALMAEGAYVLDLSSADPEEIVWRMEDVDILIDAGGCFGSMSFTDIDDQDWMSAFDENVLQAARYARLAVPGMLMNRAWRCPWWRNVRRTQTKFSIHGASQVSQFRNYRIFDRSRSATIEAMVKLNTKKFAGPILSGSECLGRRRS